MPKRVVSKSSTGSLNVEKALVDNFIALQQVMTNLAVKLDDLSTKMGKLLELFEISAKAIAENDLSLDGGPSKKVVADMSGKLDRLLDQNKVLAKGVSLLHEIPEHPSKTPEIAQKPMISPEMPKPKESFPQDELPPKVGDLSKKDSTNKEEDEENGKEDYHKSISAEASKPDAGKDQRFP